MQQDISHDNEKPSRPPGSVEGLGILARLIASRIARSSAGGNAKPPIDAAHPKRELREEMQKEQE